MRRQFGVDLIGQRGDAAHDGDLVGVLDRPQRVEDQRARRDETGDRQVAPDGEQGRGPGPLGDADGRSTASIGTLGNTAAFAYSVATAMLAMIPPAIVVMVMQKWFVKGLVDTEK